MTLNTNLRKHLILIWENRIDTEGIVLYPAFVFHDVVYAMLLFSSIRDISYCSLSLQPGKVGAIFASIPLPIIAALNCVLFGYVCKFSLINCLCRALLIINLTRICNLGYAASAGLGFLQFCNLNSFRTKFVLGSSFFLGLSIPQYFIENFHVKHQHGWVRGLNRNQSMKFNSQWRGSQDSLFKLEFPMCLDYDQI